MKTLVAMTLYAIGIVVFMIWILKDADAMKELNKFLEEDDWYSTLPENIVNLLIVLVVLIVGLGWPLVTLRELASDLKKKSK